MRYQFSLQLGFLDHVEKLGYQLHWRCPLAEPMSVSTSIKGSVKGTGNMLRKNYAVQWSETITLTLPIDKSAKELPKKIESTIVVESMERKKTKSSSRQVLPRRKSSLGKLAQRVAQVELDLGQYLSQAGEDASQQLSLPIKKGHLKCTISCRQVKASSKNTPLKVPSPTRRGHGRSASADVGGIIGTGTQLDFKSSKDVLEILPGSPSELSRMSSVSKDSSNVSHSHSAANAVLAEKLAAAKKTLVHQEKRLEDAQKELAEMQAKQQADEARMRVLAKQKKNLEKELANRQVGDFALKHENADLEKAIKEENSNLEEAQLELSSLDGQADVTESEFVLKLKADIEQLRREKESLEKQIEDNTRTIRELTVKLEKQTQVAAESSAQETRLNEEVDSLKRKIAEHEELIEKRKVEFAKFQRESGERSEEDGRSTVEVDEGLDLVLEKLRMDLDEALKARDGLNNSNERLQREVTRLETDLQVVTENLAERRMNDVFEREQRDEREREERRTNASLHGRLTERGFGFMAEEDDLAVSEEDTKQLISQQMDAENEIRHLRNDLHIVTKLHRTEKAQKKTLQYQFDDTQREISALKLQITQYERTNDQLKEQINGGVRHKQANRANLERRANDAERDARKYQSEVLRLTSEVRLLERQLAVSRDQVAFTASLQRSKPSHLALYESGMPKNFPAFQARSFSKNAAHKSHTEQLLKSILSDLRTTIDSV